jgi:hypothetical protein
MFDTEDILEAMKDDVEDSIAEGEFQCEAEECSSEQFDVSLYVADGSRFEGAAICRECNTRHEVNIPVEGMEDMDDAAQDLEDSMNDIEITLEL